MSLTNTQIDLVQSTFAQVKDADLLASIFYNRLFHVNPTLRDMFKEDMKEQRQKLIQILAVVVNSLKTLETIIPAVESLGRRHVAYGVMPQDWETVGNALLWALEEVFGSAFTPDIREAWGAAYTLLAETAMAAAYPAV